MNTKVILNSALALIATNAISAQTKPNVLYIMTDQQSYNMMSCMGNKWLSTPNMDKIAKMGTRFDHSYCVNPVSQPSRFSLLTGHYASEVGVKQNSPSYNKEAVTAIISKDALGHLFTKAGYDCVYSGKTHLYGTRDVMNYGFKLNSLDPYDGPAIFSEKFLADKSTQKEGKPFFMFLSFMNPHDICPGYWLTKGKSGQDNEKEGASEDPTKYLALQKAMKDSDYKSQIPPRALNNAPINGENPEMVAMSSQSREWPDNDLDLYSWMYHRLTESVDAQIGRVLTALENSGQLENTIIVFTSDHGDMNGAHGCVTKNTMYEECQRVPFIIAGKGIKSNYIDKTTLVCNGLDLIPTICDLTNVTCSKGLAGVSLKPYLTGEGTKPNRKYIITENFNGYQINDGRYKLSKYELPGNPVILTDIQTNPGETINYANVASYKSIRKSLETELMVSLKQRGLTPLPEDRTIKNLRAIDRQLKGNNQGDGKNQNKGNNQGNGFKKAERKNSFIE